jgi:RNA polymerase sigma factor (sigma-70 family)
LHSRSPFLRLQSDERLVGLCGLVTGRIRVARDPLRGNAFAFCRHLLGRTEDAEDVLQEVLAAAFKAIIADARPIHLRPWLYRIARNRSLNHLRRDDAVTADSMDIHFSDNGATTADLVQRREEFRLLVADIHTLPKTQRTALVLREMQALSYEQIAATMGTTVPAVKSLLVRARGSGGGRATSRASRCEPSWANTPKGANAAQAHRRAATCAVASGVRPSARSFPGPGGCRSSLRGPIRGLGVALNDSLGAPSMTAWPPSLTAWAPPSLTAWARPH